MAGGNGRMTDDAVRARLRALSRERGSELDDYQRQFVFNVTAGRQASGPLPHAARGFAESLLRGFPVTGGIGQNLHVARVTDSALEQFGRLRGSLSPREVRGMAAKGKLLSDTEIEADGLVFTFERETRISRRFGASPADRVKMYDLTLTDCRPL